jgi:eukaryotic-like serine/threonine-protein kinase
MSLEPGQILDGKYRVGRLIGEGGMGTVYEGENSRIGRRVAIKVLHAQVASMPEFVERFEREARAAARIGSPHVCDVLDLGDLPSGDRYIVMEYLDGTSFEDRLVQRTKLTAAQLAPIAFELLEGLGTMHVARVIHRDLKPANVFLAKTPSGRGEVVKILDFGVAKLQPFEGEVGTMTQTGTMMGTPLYMSPEQARGARDVDGRTDIYAASVMFYRALAGVLPYTADTLNELLFKIVLEEPKPIRDVAPEVDEVFAAIVHKGLARDLSQRFQTAREYQEAIAAWGKTQGRSSLAFAVTMPSEPPEPPSTPSDLSSVPMAKAVTPASNGTPTAWSEDGPEAAAKRASSQGKVAAMRPAAGTPGDPAPPTPTVASGASARARAAAAASAPPEPLPPISAVASTMAVKSDPPPDGPWSEGPPAERDAAPANAITSPTGAAVDVVTPSSSPRTARPADATRRGGRGMAIGVAVAGVLAIGAFFAFGRTHATPTTPPGGEVASSSASATAANASPASPTATDVPSTATGVVAAADAATPTPDPPATVGARRDPPAPARRLDPKAPLASATTPPSPPASVAVATAAPTAPPVASTTAPPKPTGSAARKFRTNLD